MQGQQSKYVEPILPLGLLKQAVRVVSHSDGGGFTEPNRKWNGLFLHTILRFLKVGSVLIGDPPLAFSMMVFVRKRKCATD